MSRIPTYRGHSLGLLQQDKEREHLRVELEEARDKMRHRSLGNIKFIGELFKMKMLTASIMDDCIVKLLKNHDEESLECLCRLLSTVGKNLDFKKAKVSTSPVEDCTVHTCTRSNRLQSSHVQKSFALKLSHMKMALSSL